MLDNVLFMLPVMFNTGCRAIFFSFFFVLGPYFPLGVESPQRHTTAEEQIQGVRGWRRHEEVQRRVCWGDRCIVTLLYKTNFLSKFISAGNIALGKKQCCVN
ncbi:hypothetical protein ACROYT_G025347 [Oculina patagonica]